MSILPPRTFQKPIFILFLLLICGFRSQAITIYGPTCVLAVQTYSYYISGISSTWNIAWCVSGGTIQGLHNGCTQGVGYPYSGVQITWDASGTVNPQVLVTTDGGSGGLSVTVTPTFLPGTITSTNPLPLANGSIPPTITCPAASAVTCGAAAYECQWESAPNNVNFLPISGAALPDLSFSTGLTQTMYYRRRVTETTLNNTAYSNVATVFVLAPLSGGSITPASQTINNGTGTSLQISGVTGGSGSFIYYWMSSSTPSNFQDIPGAYGPNITTYNPTNLTNAVYYYQVRVTSSVATSYSSIATVNVYPALKITSILPASQTVAYNGSAQITVTASGGNSSYSYIWQSSPDGSSWSTISGEGNASYTATNVTGTTYYQVIVTSNGASVTSPVVSVTLNTTDNVNFVRVRDIKRPGITDVNTANGLTDVNDLQQTTQYFDGLGRSVQTVVPQITPKGHDLVTPKVYDAVGREAIHYLPYVSESSDGKFKLNEIAEQGRFYSTQFPDEQFYYGKVEFDSSPLNRSLNTFSAGASWVGSSRGTSAAYLINTSSDSIWIWTIDSTIGSIPATNSMYAGGTLYKHAVTDEDGHQSIEYMDLQGKLILKKVQLWPLPSIGHSGWLNTYYVYDDMDELRCVIQPKAVEWLRLNGWNFSNSGGNNVFSQLCFRYEYDARKRMIIKKLPGIGEHWMVYDSRDRLVLEQDSAKRKNSKWLFTRYDNLNRIDSIGVLTFQNNDRRYHQNLANSQPIYPVLSQYSFLIYKQYYYDNYDWAGGLGISSSMATDSLSNSLYFVTTYNSGTIYAVPVTQYPLVRGLSTGTRTNVLKSSTQYIPVVKFYDDRGRIIQTQAINYTGGLDTITTQYDFNGNPLRIYSKIWKGTKNLNSQDKIEGHTVLTKMDYDPAYRMKHIWKNLDNAPTDQLIDSLFYNELGQLHTKYLGNALDSLVYEYNLRGWLKGINLSYLRGLSNNYYGMEISYDKPQSVVPSGSYQNAYYNGNIAGLMWKSAGDSVDRKYDFSYDNINRLINAGYQDNKNGAFDTSAMNYSVKDLTYDLNGNILSMSQQGFKLGNTGAVIDKLSYSYQPNSNKLMYVLDAANDSTTLLGDFHYGPSTKDSADYTYDGNGNISFDKNRKLQLVHNDLDYLVNVIKQIGQSQVIFDYDADGNRLAMETLEKSSNRASRMIYLGDLVYQATDTFTFDYPRLDTVQYMKTEEGRARWSWHASTNSYGWEYDFFEKDHLGSTRVVLTQEKDTAHYLASMEGKYRSIEDQLFYNISTSNYSRASVMAYPIDTSVTNPNDSVVRVNGNGPKMGPAIILKVMSGDKVDIGVNYYYNSTSTATGQTLQASDIITSLATGIVSTTGATHGSFSDLTGASSPLPSGLTSFLNNKNDKVPGKPNAYLNWILLDNQFNYVSSYPQSGALPVGAAGTQPGGTLQSPLAQTGIPINKSGHLYIYVSNATPGWDVFFDNLSVTHYRGPLLEENHYYPFGLSMSAISDKAIKPRYSENKFRYIGKELLSNTFSAQGIDLYDFAARMFDPQLGV